MNPESSLNRFKFVPKCVFHHGHSKIILKYRLKDVHKPRKEYAIWLNFGYVVVYLKILRPDFFQIFLPRRLVVLKAQMGSYGVFRKSDNFYQKYSILLFFCLNCWYCDKEQHISK